MTMLIAEIDESARAIEIRLESELHAQIATLDGATKTLILLRRENDRANLKIGGGPERLVVAWDRNGDPPYWTLLTESPMPHRAELIVGGQLADFEPAVAVTRSEAIAAAGEFMRTGERTSALAWREE